MDIGYLFVTDFDGTVADTFQKSPNGSNVHKAYEYAIKKIFGDEGIVAYLEIGGLQNRAPEELVSLILQHNGSLIGSAEKFFDSHGKILGGLVLAGKGAPLEWRRGNDDCIRRTIAEMLVLMKLSFLIGEIGETFPDRSVWPQPCAGFLTFLEYINYLRETEGIDIDLAIISSGHDKFIEKTFLAWGFSPPAITVTDDDMRGRRYPPEVEERVKPSPFLFDLIQSLWLDRCIMACRAQEIELFRKTRKRMMYFGDDLNKDGMLAVNSDVPFGLFDSSGTYKSEGIEIGNSIIFQSWHEIVDLLKKERVKKLLRNGGSLFEIV